MYSDSSCDVSKHTLTRYFDFDEDVLFVEGDKNVVFVCISKFDLLPSLPRLTVFCKGFYKWRGLFTGYHCLYKGCGTSFTKGIKQHFTT